MYSVDPNQDQQDNDKEVLLYLHLLHFEQKYVLN
jgi:hypothetical protein